MDFCVYGASSNEIHEDYLAAGEELGRCLARHGHGLIFGAGIGGLMGAVARGVREIGGSSVIGIVPSFFSEEGILFPDCTQLIRTKTMRERKQRMETLSQGFIITPGGIGTLDEFFEILTLRQLKRHQKPIAILNTRGYYDAMEQMLNQALIEGFMREGSGDLYRIFEEPEELVNYLETYK